MNARPVIQGGSERPDRKKSVLVRVSRRSAQPDPEHGGEVHRHHDIVHRRELGDRGERAWLGVVDAEIVTRNICYRGEATDQPYLQSTMQARKSSLPKA